MIFFKKVAYRTRRITGVISELKNIPLSLKYIFTLRFISAAIVFIFRLP